jgi:hypothetical protein
VAGGLDAAVQVESGEGLRLAQGVQCRLGGGVGLEELIYARGGQCPIYDVVGGDQTQADVGFVGAACDVDEGRHGVRFEDGECAEIDHDCPGC